MSDVEWRAYVGHALIQDSDLGDALGKLARHEATLMNGFTKTLQLLFLLQGQPRSGNCRANCRSH